MHAALDRLPELQGCRGKILLSWFDASQIANSKGVMMDTAVTGDFRTFHKARRAPAGRGRGGAAR
jgi:hypothetical protein